MLMDKYKNYEFLVTGDYNLRDTVWSNYGDLSENVLAESSSDGLGKENATLLINMFSFFGMSQFFSGSSQ